MTLSEILETKETRLESVPTAFSSKVEKVQKETLKELLALVDNLDRQEGKIVPSVENLALIQTISEKLSTFIFEETEYSEALKTFLKEFDTQASFSQEYLKKISNDFENKIAYKTMLRNSQKITLELLSKAGISQNFISPLKDVLLSSVSNAASMKDTIAILTDVVLGSDAKEGALLSHVKQVAFDAFAFSDRQYMKMVSADLGFEWFQYFGNRIADSRYFCVQRAGEIYHLKEVEYWGETPSLWNKPPGSAFHGGGRVPETNKATIWTYAGGYNCRHQIAPVASSKVPESAKQRAKKAGYI